jgi:hypothetical protein
MSHAKTADKLLIKPAAGARPAPPRTRGQFIRKARTRRPVTRRVTRGTATTRLATASDRPTRRVLPPPEAALDQSLFGFQMISQRWPSRSRKYPE